jgi:hypothetical protein
MADQLKSSRLIGIELVFDRFIGRVFFSINIFSHHHQYSFSVFEWSTVQFGKSKNMPVCLSLYIYTQGQL